MRPLALRPLTEGEKILAFETFGAALKAERVRILALPVWDRAFVAGPRLMVWPAKTAPPDFSAPTTPLRTQAVFVHELTHVWQAQRGVSLLLGKLRAGDRADSYEYDLDAGPGFEAMNIEQQAMVVEHAFLAARGGETPHPAAYYTAASVHWRKA